MDKSSRLDIALVDQKKAWNEWIGEHRERSISPVSERQATVILDWFASLNRTDLDIIDLGCGSGWMSERLLRFGRVVGADLADEVIERARQRAPTVEFVSGDLFTIDLPNNAFDVVVSLEVLSHIADKVKFLQRAKELLKPNGLLMVATQNRYVLERWDAIRGPIPGQIRRWVDARELRELLSGDFDLLRLTSVVPVGHGGFLRIVNSTRVNALLTRILSKDTIQHTKERFLFGHTLLALAQRRK